MSALPHVRIGGPLVAALFGLAACQATIKVQTPASYAKGEPPKDHSTRVYTDGPVPVLGEKPVLPYIVDTKGRAVLVASLQPGSLVAFPSPEQRPPGEILIRKHRNGTPASTDETWRVPARVLMPPSAGAKAPSVAFELPQLPAGVYDAWYLDGKPTGRGRPPSLPPPEPKASQALTFEVRPQLRAARAVARGKVGDKIEVAVALMGTPPAGRRPTNSPVVTLAGFNAVASSSGSTSVPVGADGFARFKVRLDSEGDVYLSATTPGVRGVVVRVTGGPLHGPRDHRLQPGDLLLCQGNSIFSKAIQFGERKELGSDNPHGRPWYSHVAIYLGDGQTAEMLKEGLVRHSLDDTESDCTTLDVYRRNGITPAQQQKVVESVRAYGDAVPYAWGQISVLGAAGALGLALKAEKKPLNWVLCGLTLGLACEVEAVVDLVLLEALELAEVDYLADEGKQRMICSELAAWAYSDAALPLDVAPWWPDVRKTKVFGLPDAPTDFTSPNMISHSRDVNYVFQLWPPPPPATIAAGQIRLPEQIVFDTGSAEIKTNMEDLLAAVVAVLKEDTKIRVRVEGHTDDVGTTADNQGLSGRRADAVLKWLVAHGVDAARLSSAGFGATRPLVPNDSPHNRHKNRRVEFHIEGAISAGEKLPGIGKLTLADLAWLASDAYGASNPPRTSCTEITRIGPTKTSGFRAAAFSCDGQLVVSYAGTDPANMCDDAADLALGKISLAPQLEAPFLELAETRLARDNGTALPGVGFTHECVVAKVQEAEAFYDSAVKASGAKAAPIVVGHSLGGFLAELIGLRRNIIAHAFNPAPGSSRYPGTSGSGRLVTWHHRDGDLVSDALRTFHAHTGMRCDYPGRSTAKNDKARAGEDAAHPFKAHSIQDFAAALSNGVKALRCE